MVSRQVSRTLAAGLAGLSLFLSSCLALAQSSCLLVGQPAAIGAAGAVVGHPTASGRAGAGKAVPLQATCLDIDGNGASDALTDGLLIIRYLFGLTGQPLVNGATGTGATRTEDTQVIGYLGSIAAALDVDGDENADAMTDGLLILRYLFGLRGAPLVAEATAAGAPRNAEQIEDYIQALLAAPLIQGPPPDPATVAPPVDPTVPSSIFATTAFLYTGANPIQTGVAPGTIDARRAAVLRGKVQTRDGAVLPGVAVTILAHPEFGQTLSRADGAFDLVVNGGGVLSVDYRKAGFFPVHRQVNVPWQDYAALPDVAMVALDTEVTAISLGAAAIQVARGSTATDADGTRRATLLIPPGTTASLLMPDGSTQPVGVLNIRATEYTVGADGPKAMPAPLPPTSGYTYAVELSADEAIAAGAARVAFNQPLVNYVENFLDFPVGGAVPTGYYDRASAMWVPSANGRVIRITAIAAGGLADVDSVGTGVLPPLVIDDAEREQLALLYGVGQELWRVPIPHFSPWDHNWPAGPPPDATGPAVPPPANAGPVDDPHCSGGSVIECENQTLGESVGIVGTPHTLNYRSDRVPGRSVARTLRITLSGPSVPASLERIELEVHYVGRTFLQNFGPGASQQTLFNWDGLDAYGRTPQGGQLATVTIHYIYTPVYMAPAVLAASLGSYGGAVLSGSRSRGEVRLSRTYHAVIGGLDARAFGLGGWSLSAHHFYDPVAPALYLGNSVRRSGNALGNIITTVAGNGVPDYSGDGGQAAVATLSSPAGVAVGPDGSLYIGDHQNHRIRRVDPGGVITTVAGNGVANSTGDGGPATQASLLYPIGIARGADGSLYIAESLGNRIRRVGPDGIITTVAGNGINGFSGDGGPATQAAVGEPNGVATGPDGSLYIVDTVRSRIRRVGPDGIITTVAGNGINDYTGDGGPATQATLDSPVAVAVGPDGSLYIAQLMEIRRVGTDGIISTVAGNRLLIFFPPDIGDNGPATQASLIFPYGVAVGRDGALYIADLFHDRIRRVGLEGIITTVAGNGIAGFSGDGGQAVQASINSVQAIAAGPEGSLYLAEFGNHRIRRVASPLPNHAGSGIILAAADGSVVYEFDPLGRHVRTAHGLTGATLLEFGYDAAGRLSQVSEKTGGTDNVTTIQRDANGKPTAIVAPFGQQTGLGVDAQGFLANITNPAGEQVLLASTAGGLLTSLTDPRGKTSSFAWDADGRLATDADPAGGAQNLARTTTTGQFIVTRATALGRTTTYKVENLPGAIRKRSITAPDGTLAVIEQGMAGGATTMTAADGTVASLQSGPDPRFGMLAPVASSRGITLPGGPTITTGQTRTTVLANPLDPLSFTSLTASSTVAGRTTTASYATATRIGVATSPAGRAGTVELDVLGRVVQSQAGGLAPATFAYDARGRLASMTRGSGGAARTYTLGYNAQGFLVTITDPLARTVEFTHDSAGRVIGKTLPDGSAVAFGYDAAGNLTSLTPPGRPPHTFGYSHRNELTLVTPPAVPATGPGSFAFNADRQRTTEIRPDNRSVTIGYDASGRPNARVFATGGVTTGTDAYGYDAAGRVATVTAAGGVTTSFTHAGWLPTGESWSGVVAGNVTATWDTGLRLSSQSVNGANTVAFVHDDDNLLIGAGTLAISRDPQHGRATGSTLGVVGTTTGYNGFGEATSHAASANASPLFSVSLVRDALGRISQKTETIDGVTDTYDYTYNLAGRLAGVAKNSTPVESYGYDSNGNRTSASVDGASSVAAYDDQDRLVSHGTATYNHTAAGELLSRTVGGQTTHYAYDAMGNLVGVTLPGGTSIAYVVDGLDRRVGKRVNATLVQGLLYGDALRPVAELDGTGTLVSRFVYAGEENVPAYALKGGVAHRIITDHLGSVRLVVNAVTGAAVQRIDYDTFGNVILDTNPGFQPFGFAGGLYDPDTGLVRFGARDYDSQVGRWTAKDPIGFRGGDTNLYAYAANDPVNFKDARGLDYGTGMSPIGGPADTGEGQSRVRTYLRDLGRQPEETMCFDTRFVPTPPNMLFPELWKVLIELTGEAPPRPGPVMGGPRG